MYGRGAGDLTAIVPTAAGVVILPNTGGNSILFVVSLLSTVIGSLIIASTLMRLIAKRIYNS